MKTGLKRLFKGYFVSVYSSRSLALWLGVALCGLGLESNANDIRFSGVGLLNRDTVAGAVQIQFNVSWQNSWRLPATLQPANRDAAWVFFKFRVGFVDPNFRVSSAAAAATTLTVNTTQGLRVGMPIRVISGTGTLPADVRITAVNSTTNEVSISAGVSTALSNAILEGTRIWEHVWLHNADFQVPTGAVLQPALQDEAAAFNSTTNPVTGILVYRNAPGSGAFAANGMRVRWNYRAQGLDNEDIVDVKAFGVELVYLPEGSFLVGSGGTEAGSFTAADADAGPTVPFTITSTAPTLQGVDAASSADNLGARSSTDLSGTTTASLNANFPTGYAGTYLMKYEISQQQYVDFLNTLSREQQQSRTATNLAAGVSAVTDRYVLSGSSSLQNRNGIRCDASVPERDPITFYCDLNGNDTGGETADGMFLACNFLSWPDVAAFFDWAALRPISELEYEKAARGSLPAVANAFAWNTTAIQAATGISASGQADETASNTGANAAFGSEAGVPGPMRVGNFANSETGRQAAGAGQSGILELSGNLWEQCISVGTANGRSFDGSHGDGALAQSGAANVSGWPDHTGTGLRGGSWQTAADRLRTSDRQEAANGLATRQSEAGARGARSIPSLAAIDGGNP